MRNVHFILDEHGNPKDEPDVVKWGEWFEHADRTIASDEVGPFRVSTIFLALNYGSGFNGTSVLWETMVFRQPSDPSEVAVTTFDNLCLRYKSKEDAIKGHAKILEATKQRFAELSSDVVDD